ncbi:MAG: hypothetical protein M3N26_05380 [Pseudomonadota bacterium]|nr:hypothetical protein [Pseudomonadota bacterium]
MTHRKLTPAAREDLIQAIQHGMLFDGRKRTHHWDRINAQIAAEKLADYLVRANYVVMRGPPAPAHNGDTRHNAGEADEET